MNYAYNRVVIIAWKKLNPKTHELIPCTCAQEYMQHSTSTFVHLGWVINSYVKQVSSLFYVTNINLNMIFMNLLLVLGRELDTKETWCSKYMFVEMYC